MDAIGPDVDVALGRQIALLPACARRARRPSAARWWMPTTRQHPCRAAPPAPRRSRRSRYPSGRGSAAASRSSSTGACRAAGSRENRMRSGSSASASRSRTRGWRTATGPMPVMTSRSGRWPWRTTRRWPSSVFRSACLPRKSATSASTAWASRARAPLRKTSVSWSSNVSWLNQFDDVIVGHGISLLRWRSGGVEHPHDMPPSRFTPSPTLGHSSTLQYTDIDPSQSASVRPLRLDVCDSPEVTISPWCEAFGTGLR